MFLYFRDTLVLTWKQEGFSQKILLFYKWPAQRSQDIAKQGGLLARNFPDKDCNSKIPVMGGLGLMKWDAYVLNIILRRRRDFFFYSDFNSKNH